jgi:hypothetical protein
MLQPFNFKLVESMNKLTIASAFFILSLLPSFGSMAQESRIFDLVKGGDVNSLRAYLDTTKTSVNVLNAKGYTPLHVLIENYVEERLDLRDKDSFKYQQTVKQGEQFRTCLQLLLDKGASAKQLTPEGWTALQYAVMKGKWEPVNLLLQKTKGGDVRDKEGNTLLHLSLLINPDEPIEHFWKNLIDKLRPFDITTSTVNFKGQTPINFYLREPRCNPPATQRPVARKLAGASAPPSNQPCQTFGTSKMLENFLCEPCILVPDFSGARAKDYTEVHNKWYLFDLLMKEQLYAYSAETNKKYQVVAENNKRATEEYLRKLAEWEEQGSKLDVSFNRTYYYLCNSYQNSRIKMDEPVVVTVTPDYISVSSLVPYYGKFKVASSGYEVINGNEWAVYHLEKTSSNSTYSAIGFYNNGCIIKSSYGEELICY